MADKESKVNILQLALPILSLFLFTVYALAQSGVQIADTGPDYSTYEQFVTLYNDPILKSKGWKFNLPTVLNKIGLDKPDNQLTSTQKAQKADVIDKVSKRDLGINAKQGEYKNGIHASVSPSQIRARKHEQSTTTYVPRPN